MDEDIKDKYISTDSRDKEHRDAIEAAAVGEAVIAALRGQPVSEFMESFAPVQEAIQLRRDLEAMTWERDEAKRIASVFEKDLARMAKYLDTANARIAARAERFRALLAEWRKTPFFEAEDDWQEWVNEFGRRVDAALSDAEPTSPPRWSGGNPAGGGADPHAGRGSSSDAPRECNECPHPAHPNKLCLVETLPLDGIYPAEPCLCDSNMPATEEKDG